MESCCDLRRRPQVGSQSQKITEDSTGGHLSARSWTPAALERLRLESILESILEPVERNYAIPEQVASSALKPLQASRRGMVPDNEGLVDVALCCECNDVVAAAQLGKSVALGVALELHTAAACLDIHNPCT